MKLGLALFLLLFSFSAHSDWDSSVLVGEWENYHYGYSHRYQKLIINSDFTGSYFYITENTEGESVKIIKDNFQFFDGFAVLNIDNFKIILSAWGKRMTGDTKRLLGQIFIYNIDGKELNLINSEPISFNSSIDNNFQKFADKIRNAK